MVLKSLAMIALQNFRKTDIVARYGGDEFVFILTNSDLENATMVMSRLEAQFTNWASIHNIKVGLSYGIKELSDSVEKLDEILHAADESLYLGKTKQTNTTDIKKPAPNQEPVLINILLITMFIVYKLNI